MPKGKVNKLVWEREWLLSWSWRFSILGFTSAFEARHLENPKKKLKKLKI